MANLQHSAVFMGDKVRLTYAAKEGYYKRHWDEFVEPRIDKVMNHIGYEIIEEVYLDNPPLEVGDYIYINKLNDKYKVSSVARSTNNEYIYYVDYIVKTVEDEETKESKNKAEELMVEYQKKYAEIKKYYEEKMANHVEEVLKPKKKWYQFLK